MELLTPKSATGKPLKTKIQPKYKHFVLEYDRAVCTHSNYRQVQHPAPPTWSILTLPAREKMTKRVFVTVGSTSFDELIQAATEDKFLKVCYVETSVHVCCVHNKHSGHSTLKVLWLGPYPVCSIKVG